MRGSLPRSPPHLPALPLGGPLPWLHVVAPRGLARGPGVPGALPRGGASRSQAEPPRPRPRALAPPRARPPSAHWSRRLSLPALWGGGAAGCGPTAEGCSLPVRPGLPRCLGARPRERPPDLSSRVARDPGTVGK